MTDPIIHVPEFWAFVAERQRIWYERRVDMRPAPWTTDEILRDNRFTNVYRCLDKGTLWPIWEILYDDITAYDKIYQIVMYRLLNRISSFKVLRRPYIEWDEDEWHRGLQALRDKKQPIMTSAYVPITMVTGGPIKGVINKVGRVGSILADDIEGFTNELLECRKMEDAHEVIRHFCKPYNIGPFVSFQILLDLTYPLSGGESLLPDLDPNTWVYMGPGSRKSIGALGKEHGMKPAEVCLDLCFHQKTHLKDLGFKTLFDRTTGDAHALSLADVEHALCEWYKYKRIGENGYVKANTGPGEYTPPRQLPPWLEA